MARRVTSRRSSATDALSNLRADQEPRAVDNVTTDGLQREMAKMRLTPKTTDLEKYRLYAAYREASRETFESTYCAPLFRAMRFTAWTKREKSLETFVKKILETYGTRRSHGMSVNQQVAILYGDWATQGALHPACRSQRHSR